MSKIRRQSIVGAALTVLGVILGFVNSAVLQPEVLDPRQIGMLKMLLTYAKLTLTVCGLGFGAMAIKLFPPFKHHGAEGEFMRLWWRYLAIGLSVGLLFLLFSEDWLLRNNAEALKPYVVPMVLLYLGHSLMVFADNQLVVRFQSIPGALSREIILRILVIGLLLAMWLEWIPFPSLVTGFSVAYVICGVALTLYLLWKVWKTGQLRGPWKKPQLPPGVNWKEVYSLSAFGVLNAGAAMLLLETDVLMVTYISGLDDTGVYAVLFYFGVLVAIPSRVMFKISSAVIGDAWKTDNRKLIQDIYEKSALYLLFAGAFIYVMITVNMDEVFVLMPNGEKYERGARVAFWIGAGQLVNMLTGASGQIVATSLRYRYNLMFNLCLIALMVILNFLLIPLFGITGAAMATAISMVLVNAFRWWMVKHWFGFQPFRRPHLYTLVFCLGVWIALQVSPFPPGLSGAALRSILACLAFLAWIWFSGQVPELRERIEVYTGMVRKMLSRGHD